MEWEVKVLTWRYERPGITGIRVAGFDYETRAFLTRAELFSWGNLAVLMRCKNSQLVAPRLSIARPKNCHHSPLQSWELVFLIQSGLRNRLCYRHETLRCDAFQRGRWWSRGGPQGPLEMACGSSLLVGKSGLAEGLHCKRQLGMHCSLAGPELLLKPCRDTLG